MTGLPANYHVTTMNNKWRINPKINISSLRPEVRRAISIAHYSLQLSDPQLENVHHTIFNALEDYQTQSTQISTHEGQKAD